MFIFNNTKYESKLRINILKKMINISIMYVYLLRFVRPYISDGMEMFMQGQQYLIKLKE